MSVIPWWAARRNKSSGDVEPSDDLLQICFLLARLTFPDLCLSGSGN